MRTLLLAAALVWPMGAAEWVAIPGRPIEVNRTEVTVGEFGRFTGATRHVTTAEQDGASRTWRRPGFAVRDRQPVVYVSVEDAEAYCEWSGGRLLTDEEWEYTARAGAATRHYWGEAIDGDYLWYRPNAREGPQPVGTRKPNAWGLHDVEGNVWEWVWGDRQQRLASRRGGSWVACEDIEGGPGKGPSPLIGLAVRFRVPATLRHRSDDIGFRCARDVMPAAAAR